MELLKQSELPAGMAYPGAFLRLVERGVAFLEPWCVLEGDRLSQRFRGLRDRYPNRTLLPFARREDNDDVACWERGKGRTVVVIHDFSSPGGETRAEFPDFYAWLRRAVEDMIEFDVLEDEDDG